MLKKFLYLLLFLTFNFTSNAVFFADTVNAQITPSGQVNELYESVNHTWYSEMDFFAWYRKVYDKETPESEIFGERYTAAQVQWVLYGVISQALNIFPGSTDLIVNCTGGDVLGCSEAFNRAIDAVNPVSNNLNSNVSLSTVFNHYPVSGIYYVKDLISKFSIVETANAQGFGYNTANNSLRSVWTATRNISYGFIVIATIIISFMIMFQIKINPQTVISIQVAIPKIIIASILITFSYAIAGFAIDLMYVVLGLVAMILSGSGLSGFSPIELFGQINALNSFGLLYAYWAFFVGAAATVSTEGNGLGALLLILAIISIIAIFFWSLKILMMVMKNFAMLIITIITGPIEIMLGTATQSVGFNTWIRKMITYLAFYPVLVIMFFLSFFFLNQGGATPMSFDANIPFNPAKDIITANSWTPPLSSISGGSYSITWIIISFVIFSEITKVAEIVQGFISGKPWAFGHGLNESLESGSTAAAGIGGAIPSTSVRAASAWKGTAALLSALSKGI